MIILNPEFGGGMYISIYRKIHASRSAEFKKEKLNKKQVLESLRSFPLRGR